MKILLPLLLLSLAAPYQYEPTVTTLSGTLKNDKVFYGPPGYGEDPKHDRQEKPIRLVLDTPIDVEGRKDDPINSESEKAVRELTIVPGKVQDLKDHLGQHVTVTGKMFHAHTGHHHTAVLIDLETLKSDPPKK